MRSTLFICGLVTAIGFFQCAATQLSALALETGKPSLGHHILFLTYIGLYWNLLFLPVAHLVDKHEERKEQQQQHEHLQLDLQQPQSEAPSSSSVPSSSLYQAVDHTAVHDEERSQIDAEAKKAETMLQTTLVVFVLYLLYVGANACYMAALNGLSPAIVGAIFSSCPVFVVLFSRLFLALVPTILQNAAVVLGIVGVLCSLQPWDASGENSSGNDSSINVVAVICAVLSPIFAAAYKVTFARRFEGAKWHEAARILGYLPAINVIAGTVLMVVVYAIGLETPFWSRSTITITNQSNHTTTTATVVSNTSRTAAPATTTVTTTIALADVPGEAWAINCAASIVSLGFNLLVNWGVTCVSPLHVSIGTLMATGLNVLADAAVGRGWPSGAVVWIGIGLISMSFFALGYSNNKQEREQRSANEQEVADVGDE